MRAGRGRGRAERPPDRIKSSGYAGLQTLADRYLNNRTRHCSTCRGS
jgi:hypothetical protein